MKKKIFTSIRINACIEEVWQTLTDFENYSEWNPFIKSLSGEVKKGNQITVKLQGMTFKPIVTAFDKHKEFKWLGHLLFKGLFDGEHRFYLKENRDGTTTLEHSENFNGVLVMWFSKSLDRDTQKGFEKMNQAIKERAERIAIQQVPIPL